MRIVLLGSAGLIWLVSVYCFPQNSAAAPGHLPDGKQLFERPSAATAERAEPATVRKLARYLRKTHSNDSGRIRTISSFSWAEATTATATASPGC